MSPLTYLNFDLTFESSADGYSVRATSSVAGEARAAFVFPFSELELENFLLRLGQRSSGTRRADSPEMELSKQFGGRLFAALFNDDVRTALRSSVNESERQGAGLRIRLRFGNAPELADIPWEYLYDRAANRFLTLSGETPLVRYLEQSRAVEPLQVQAPLRILVMISDPSDYDRLDVEAEWQRLTAALADLRQLGLVEIVRLDKATLLELQRLLRDNQFHIFHYIGHGVYDESADDGFLVLEEENGRGRKVGGQYVGTMLADHRTLRLAVLNSCEGGRSSRRDPYAGAAQSLVQQGLPAVIAMQFEISDDAAAVFAQEFYMALAGGYPVDAALAEGRRAIFATKTNAEWGIPVLFMRAADGVIFRVVPNDNLPESGVPDLTPSVARSIGSPAISTAEIPTAQKRPIANGVPLSAKEQISKYKWTDWLTRPIKIVVLLITGVLLLVAFSPAVYEFNAEPSVVSAGTPVVLSWNSSRFASVELSGPDLLDVQPKPRGTAVVMPMRSTTYSIESSNLLSNLGLPPLYSYRFERQVFVTPVSPEIRLSVDRDTVVLGESVTVAWEIERADRATLYSNGNPQPLPTEQFVGTMEVELKADTVFRIEASNPSIENPIAAMVSLLVVVFTPTPTPIPNPQVLAFAVQPTTITAGDPIEVTWRVMNAPSVSIEGVGAELPPEGSVQVFPTQSTTYLLRATTLGGDAFSQAVEVTVLPPPTATPVPTPQVYRFDVFPGVIDVGQSVTLDWRVESGSQVSIEGVGLNLPVEGSRQLFPRQTTTYELRASRPGFVLNIQSVTVEVRP